MAKRRWIIGVVVVVGVAGYALWPRGLRLEMYRPVISLSVWGLSTANVQILAPAGWRWKAERPYYVMVDGSVSFRPGQRSFLMETITLEPPKQMAWLPEWLRIRLGLVSTDYGGLSISIASAGSFRVDGPYRSTGPVDLVGLQATRRITKRLDYFVVYTAVSEDRFEELSESILNSFKVISETDNHGLATP